MSDSEAKKKWIKENTTTVAIKLNYNTDADIIERLEKEPSKGGYIKRLIRQDIASNNPDNIIRKVFSE